MGYQYDEKDGHITPKQIVSSVNIRVEAGGRPDTTGAATIAEIETIIGKFASGNRLTLEGKVPEVYNVGNCTEPRLILGAIADGWYTANTI